MHKAVAKIHPSNAEIQKNFWGGANPTPTRRLRRLDRRLRRLVCRISMLILAPPVIFSQIEHC